MRSLLLSFVFAVAFIPFVCGQASMPDSVLQTVQLKEVSVCERQAKPDDQFSFYRSSRLSTTEEIMVRLPGVSLIRRGSYGMEPTLRAYSGSQINLTLDGMKIAGACTDRMDPVSIYVEPANLRSIQVGTGVQGNSNGPTLGGNINMTLKDPEFSCSNKPLTGINSSFATVNKAFSENMFVNINSNKLALRVSGVYRTATDYKAGGGTVVPYSGMEKSNVSTALRYKINNTHDLKVDYLGDWGNHIGFPALPMDVGYARAAITSLTHRYTSAKNIFRSNTTKVYFNEVIHSMDDTRRPFVSMHMDMPGRSRTYGVFSEFSLQQFRRHSISGRADYYNSFTKADMTMYPLNEPQMYMQTLPDNNRINKGLYLKDDIRVDSLQSVSVSIRTDHAVSEMNSLAGKQQWSVFGSFPVSRVMWAHNFQAAWNRQLGKSVFTRLGMGYAERLPAPNELFGYFLFNRLDGYDYLGKPVLKTEQALQGEWITDISHKKWGVSVTVFYHHIRNYILGHTETAYSPVTFGAKGVKVYDNIPFAVKSGADLTFQQQLNTVIEHITTAKIVMGSTSDGKALPQMPPLKCVHMLRYKKGKLLLQGESEWALPQYRNSIAFGEMQSKAYLIFNLRAGYKISKGSHTFQLSTAIENLTDRIYREHLDFSSIPRPGRNFTFTLGYFFY